MRENDPTSPNHPVHTHGQQSSAPPSASVDSHNPPSSRGRLGNPELPRANTLNMGMLPQLRRSSTLASVRRALRGRWEPAANGHEGQWDMQRVIPLMHLIPALNFHQKAFFHKLDAEVDKIETFYVEREKEMKAR